MKTRVLVLLSLLVGMGAVLHAVMPGILGGMKLDLMLTMMFLGIILFPERKNVLLVGGDFANVKHNFTYVRTNTEAKEWFEKQNITNADILIKGSRGIGMEKIIE